MNVMWPVFAVKSSRAIFDAVLWLCFVFFLILVILSSCSTTSLI